MFHFKVFIKYVININLNKAARLSDKIRYSQALIVKAAVIRNYNWTEIDIVLIIECAIIAYEN